MREFSMAIAWACASTGAGAGAVAAGAGAAVAAGAASAGWLGLLAQPTLATSASSDTAASVRDEVFIEGVPWSRGMGCGWRSLGRRPRNGQAGRHRTVTAFAP